MRAAILVTSPKFNKPEKGSPEEIWAYSSKVNNFIEVCKQHEIPWCLVDYAHGIILPETKVKNYNNKEIDITVTKWQEGIVNQVRDNKLKSLVFVGSDGDLSGCMNSVVVGSLEALVKTFKLDNKKLSDKKFPFVPEGVELKKHKRVAATFCAGSKVDVEEGNPKQLWASASGRINAFISHCEKAGIPYVILSYKYGIVHQREVIDNYDIGKSELDMDEWGRLAVQAQLAREAFEAAEEAAKVKEVAPLIEDKYSLKTDWETYLKVLDIWNWYRTLRAVRAAAKELKKKAKEEKAKGVAERKKAREEKKKAK